MQLLVADFPLPVVLVASAFPRSPLALLAAGRTDFFILNSLTPIHLQLDLYAEEREKKSDEHQRGQQQLQFSMVEDFFPQTPLKKINLRTE